MQAQQRSNTLRLCDYSVAFWLQAFVPFLINSELFEPARIRDVRKALLLLFLLLPEAVAEEGIAIVMFVAPRGSRGGERGGKMEDEVQGAAVPVWLRLPCGQLKQTRRLGDYGRCLRFDMQKFSVSDQAYLNNRLREAGLPTWNFALQTHNGALKAVVNRLDWDSWASSPTKTRQCGQGRLTLHNARLRA